MMMQQNPVPGNILFEIFLRLPAKSIGRFVCVSKLWARIIRSKDFIRRFSFRSSPTKQPRFLFAFSDRIIKGCQENKQELEMAQRKNPMNISSEIMIRSPAKSIKRRKLMKNDDDRIKGCQENKAELETVQRKNPVPMNISSEIMIRSRVKSIARFRCVSKLWARTFASPTFGNQPPRVLFGFNDNDRIKGYQENWHFFSKPTLVSTPLRGPAPEFLSSTVSQLKKRPYKEPSYVHGLISFLCGQEQVVSNPTTGKSITLPPTLNSTDYILRSFLGYDPVDAQYKVLCLTNVTPFCAHQVLTLGGPQNWRMIQSSTPHCPLGTNSVCIDGVLYYTASGSFTITKPLLVGFDLRSETLEIASMFPEGIESYNFYNTTLINYHGKVALVTPGPYRFSFTLWVLEDAKKQEWSKQDLSFPLNGTQRYHCGLKMLGVSDMGEFIYAPMEFEELYVYFVDHKSNQIRSVELIGNTKHSDFYQMMGEERDDEEYMKRRMITEAHLD